MIRTLALSAALCAATAAQEQGPPPPADAAPSAAPVGELFDGVQLLVNNDCITHSDLLRLTFQRGQAGKGGGDLQRLFRESFADLTRDRLLQQAGRDLGYAPELIDATVRREVAAKKERFGSATALAEVLAATQTNSSMLYDDTEGTVYRYLYERAITGRGEGPGGRPYVDHHVRPGRMYLEYRRQGSRLDLPPVVHLQEIIVAPGVGEDLGSARQRAFLVRSRALRGEDFAALNREFGEATKRVGNELVHETDLDPIDERQLESLPELHAFVQAAKPGDVSDPLPAALAGGRIGGWRLVRLVERVEGVARRFEDREFQESLRERMLEEREDYEIERALRRLMQAAYVWPPPQPRPPAGAAEPTAAPSVGPPEAPPEPVEPAVEGSSAPSKPPAIGAPEPEPDEPPAAPVKPADGAPSDGDGGR